MPIENPKTLGNEHLNDKFTETNRQKYDYEYEEIDDMGRRVIKQGDQEYLVRAAHRSGLWEVYSATGGPKPKELEGFFTNIMAAEQALAAYTARKSNENVRAKQYSQDLFDKGFVPAEPREEKVKKKKA